MGTGDDPLIDEHVGHRLKERRVTIRITQLELADILNVPKSLLEKYEAGEVSIPAGAALQQSEERFRTVVNHSPTKSHIKDLEGRYLLVNKEAEKMFGVTDEAPGAERAPKSFRRNGRRPSQRATGP